MPRLAEEHDRRSHADRDTTVRDHRDRGRRGIRRVDAGSRGSRRCATWRCSAPARSRVTPTMSATLRDSDDHAMYWMQDLDDGDLAFLCIVPWVAFPDYDIEIDETHARHRRRGRHPGAVTRDHPTRGRRSSSDGEPARPAGGRHRGPGKLQQVILSDSRWPIRAPFAEFASAADALTHLRPTGHPDVGAHPTSR